MKINKLGQTCMTKMSEFFNKNGAIIVKSVALAVVSVLIKDLGLNDFTTPTFKRTDNSDENGTEQTKKTPYNSMYMLPPADNPIKEAIVGLWRTGMQANFSSTAINSAANIYNIVSANNVDPDTLQYGIMAISKISQQALFSSTKEKISRYVSDLAVKAAQKGVLSEGTSTDA